MIFLLLRVIIGPFTNLIQKKLTERNANSIFIVTVTYLFITVMMSPLLPFLDLKNLPLGFWEAIAVAAFTDGIANIFLIQSLKLTELSVFGPINAFKPVIAMILAYFLIAEVPSLNGAFGILIIIAGSLILTYPPKKPKTEKLTKSIFSRGLLYRFSGIFLSAVGAVYIKKSLAFSTPEVTLFFWAFLVLPLFVGYSLAVFQLSSIVSIFLGYKYFNESNIRIKLISATIMILGTILIFM